VYLFQPYYGVDRSFTEQYQKEAQRVAQASEGTYHYYKGDAATIDAVADAITDGGVVFFDSHGSTDYENGEDYTSGATTSYLCLQTGDGLTKADYDGGHAVYSSTSGSMKYFLVDGTVIADHMDADAQANNGLLWMAICLGNGGPTAWKSRSWTAASAPFMVTASRSHLSATIRLRLCSLTACSAAAPSPRRSRT